MFGYWKRRYRELEKAVVKERVSLYSEIGAKDEEIEKLKQQIKQKKTEYNLLNEQRINMIKEFNLFVKAFQHTYEDNCPVFLGKNPIENA